MNKNLLACTEKFKTEYKRVIKIDIFKDKNYVLDYFFKLLHHSDIMYLENFIFHTKI